VLKTAVRTANLFPYGIVFSPHPAVPVSIKLKKHGYGRATANRYFEYLCRIIL